MNPVTRRDVLKGCAGGAMTLVLGDGLQMPAHAHGAVGGKLPRARPEDVGITPESILAFLDGVEAKVGGLHSFMLLRHGKVAAEGWWAPYGPQLPHMLYSLSKSFTSTAVGLAVTEGKVKLDEPVVSFFPDKVPANVPANLAAMQVRHLLTMSTGHDKDTTGPTTAAPDGDWIKAFLALPVEHAPGSKFVYNSTATYMCSAIVQKRTGKTVIEYLTPRLFSPLGIERPTWETCPKGINTGGWGLSIKTEDIARFGQLYLQKGQWDNKELIPASWVKEATSLQVSNGTGDTSDWTQGYGYQFWRCRHGAFRGDGAFGQFCVVLPEQDAVLAITSGVGDMQAILNVAWDQLLPGIQTSVTPSEKNATLRERVGKLMVSTIPGKAESATVARVSGKTYRLDSNAEGWESAQFAFSGDRCNLTLRSPSGERKLTCTSEKWSTGESPKTTGPARLGAPPTGKIAAQGAWTAEDTYTIKTCYIETPYIETITCQFSGNDVTIARKLNVNFGPTERPRLMGHGTR